MIKLDIINEVVNKTGITKYHFLNGMANPYDECGRIGELINKAPIDLAFCGIGENGHLAFNDPPADFDTAWPYIVVTLDDACRRQQLPEQLANAPSAKPRAGASAQRGVSVKRSR